MRKAFFAVFLLAGCRDGDQNEREINWDEQDNSNVYVEAEAFEFFAESFLDELNFGTELNSYPADTETVVAVLTDSLTHPDAIMRGDEELYLVKQVGKDEWHRVRFGGSYTGLGLICPAGGEIEYLRGSVAINPTNWKPCCGSICCKSYTIWLTWR